MARIRTIKPEFWTSEQIVECSRDARLLFIGLWNFCDDGGVHPASIKRIKMEIFPGDDLTADDLQNLVDELVDNELVDVFESQGKTYWHVASWDKHQKIDRPSYKFPQFVERSTNDHRTIVDRSPPERKGTDTETEGSLKETEEGSPKPFSTKSAFAELTTEKLSEPEQVLEWLDEQQQKKRPVVGNSTADKINVLAAAYQVVCADDIERPAALFGSIVAGKRWSDLNLQAIDRATKQLRAVENRSRPPPGAGYEALGVTPLTFALDEADDQDASPIDSAAR
jgi:hypothetical protein